MDNSKKFSKPPSSLNFSRKADNGSGSSASTPSEDYKTPSIESAVIPGFDFGPREGEPEVPTRLQMLMQDAGVMQTNVGHSRTTGFHLQPVSSAGDAFSKALKTSGVMSSPVFVDERARHLASHSSAMVNGSTAKIGAVSPATLLAAKSSNESNIVPLMRSPQMSSRPAKKTTFAALPNQTTWLEETAQRGSSLEREKRKPSSDAAACHSTELSGIRLKLEERRRQIENEKKRMEMQWSKQRQQLGKEAFIQVVTKNQHGSTSQTDLRALSENERPSYHRELSDGVLPLHEQQERRSFQNFGHSDEVKASAAILNTEKVEGLKNSRGKPDVGGLEASQRTREQVAVRKKTPASSGSLEHSKNLRSEVNASKAAAGGKGVASEGREPSGSYHSDISEYSTSLDRLNSSLSELQGEIMRLSLQQDQIKSLVGSDVEPPLTHPSKRFSLHASPQSSKEQFYLFPRSAADITTGTKLSTASGSIASGVQRSTAPSQFGSMISTTSVMPPNTRSYGGLGNTSVSGVPLHSGIYPAGSSAMSGIYASPQGPYHHYFPPANPPFMTGGSYAVPPSSSLPPSVSSFPAHLPAGEHGSVNYHVHGLGSYAGTWHTGSPIQTSGAGGAGMAGGVAVSSDAAAAFPDVAVIPRSSDSASATQLRTNAIMDTPVTDLNLKTSQIHGSNLTRYDLHRSDPTHHELLSHPTSSISLSTPGSFISSLPIGEPTTPKNPTSQSEETAPSVPTPGPGEAFFMIIDPSLPRRPKPVLSTSARKKDTESITQASPSLRRDSSSAPVSSSGSSVVGETVEEKNLPGAVAFDFVPSVGFVVDVEESCANEAMQQEVEKKRLKMAELHQKRREELEQKKQKIEMEQQTKREAQRLKQEKNDEKKAKDRARREEIFQNYLQRKADDETSEDDARLNSVASKRQATPKAKIPRPKSQPPPSGGGNINDDIRSCNTPNALGGRLTDPRTGSPGSDFSRSSERLNMLTNLNEQLEARLSSLTQRTPSIAERVPRFVSSSSDGGSEGAISSGQLPDNYAGPKLFVKPSQKSNRHIIINAIKDCCLAGMVNQDTKNKVLEEINKSESKHFVILFRDAGMQFRGLYTYNPDREDVFKIHGVGPNRLLDKMMERFYKYNSGAKNFTEVTSTKHLSATIDAVTILGTLWQKKSTPGGPGKRPVV